VPHRLSYVFLWAVTVRLPLLYESMDAIAIVLDLIEIITEQLAPLKIPVHDQLALTRRCWSHFTCRLDLRRIGT